MDVFPPTDKLKEEERVLWFFNQIPIWRVYWKWNEQSGKIFNMPLIVRGVFGIQPSLKKTMDIGIIKLTRKPLNKNQVQMQSSLFLSVPLQWKISNLVFLHIYISFWGHPRINNQVPSFFDTEKNNQEKLITSKKENKFFSLKKMFFWSKGWPFLENLSHGKKNPWEEKSLY